MLGNTSWQKLCMGRARDHPLVLHCIRWTKRRDYNSKQDNESAKFLKTILPSLGKAYLKLTVPADDWSVLDEREFDDFLTQTCDDLKYLSISWDGFSLTENVLNGNPSNALTTLVLPEVRTIKAESCHFPSFSKVLIALDEEIHAQATLAESDLSMFNSPSCLPQLEVLSIEYTYQTRNDKLGVLASLTTLPLI